MEKTTDSSALDGSRVIAFSETESGMIAGMWRVPGEGFRWASEYKPVREVTRQEMDGADPGPWLLPIGDVEKQYPLLRRKGLLEAMDRLAKEPTPERILAFANRRGHRGLRIGLVPAKGPDRSQVGGTMERGESLWAWRKELMVYGELRDLWRAVSVMANQDSWGPLSVRRARSHIEDRIRWAENGACAYESVVEMVPGWPRWGSSIYHPSDEDAGGVRDLITGGNSYEAARYFVHREVNERMRGAVSPAVLPYLGSIIRFFPHSLMAAAWLRFAQDMAGANSQQRECERCRLPFLPGRSDQRFCGKNCQEASAYHRRVARKFGVRIEART